MQIDDIPNGVEWKDKPADWWMEHGATVATRFLKIFSARGGGGGAMTDQMIKGKVLRKQECDVVVQHEDFMALSVALAAEDWVTAKALTDPNAGEFGKLITRAALHFKEQGGKAGKTAADDFNMPALDQLLQTYATLWQATIAAEGSCPTGGDQAFHRYARTDRGGRRAVQPRRGSGAGTEVPGYLRSAGVTVWASTAVCSAYRARVLQVWQERAYCQGLQPHIGMRPSAEAAPTC